MKKVLKILALLLVVAAAGYGLVRAMNRGGDESPFELVAVERGTIVDKALATGQIVPEEEISVKSQISGIVKECYAKVGDTVRAGQPLFTIMPDPTPLQVTEAERNVELAQVAHAKAKADYERAKQVFAAGLSPREELDSREETFEQTRIELELARERLELLREGKITKPAGGVDSIIRAPASGTVLERLVNPGDPVVPLTTFQEGTPLATIADMGRLIFKGTVDEIDVGKLEEGLPVRIDIGALPSSNVTGSVRMIAPKAVEEEGSTLFDVEVEIEERGDAVLRAGYSANANIIIQEKTDVLIVPERLLIFEDDERFVELPPPGPEAEPEKHPVQIGLSDGINVEIVSGLSEGDQIVERPPREIE
ncbi:MAG: efflux RND transporter periplasmic adaptor subunit [Thermoanaerobaculia bacterium]|nr:efflux RND transporter periplasmic adaptor subunit [Thermoanaerobaculia bacterium]